MPFGFELFACLKVGLTTEVVEVYPFAIVRAPLPACEHKSTEQGFRIQLVAVAACTGCPRVDRQRIPIEMDRRGATHPSRAR